MDLGRQKSSLGKMAGVAVQIAVEIAKEPFDMFLPLKTVVGALAVLVRNCEVKCARVSRSIGC